MKRYYLRVFLVFITVAFGARVAASASDNTVAEVIKYFVGGKKDNTFRTKYASMITNSEDRIKELVNYQKAEEAINYLKYYKQEWFPLYLTLELEWRLKNRTLDPRLARVLCVLLDGREFGTEQTVVEKEQAEYIDCVWATAAVGDALYSATYDETPFQISGSSTSNIHRTEKEYQRYTNLFKDALTVAFFSASKQLTYSPIYIEQIQKWADQSETSPLIQTYKSSPADIIDLALRLRHILPTWSFNRGNNAKWYLAGQCTTKLISFYPVPILTSEKQIFYPPKHLTENQQQIFLKNRWPKYFPTPIMDPSTTSTRMASITSMPCLRFMIKKRSGNISPANTNGHELQYAIEYMSPNRIYFPENFEDQGQPTDPEYPTDDEINGLCQAITDPNTGLWRTSPMRYVHIGQLKQISQETSHAQAASQAAKDFSLNPITNRSVDEQKNWVKEMLKTPADPIKGELAQIETGIRLAIGLTEGQKNYLMQSLYQIMAKPAERWTKEELQLRGLKNPHSLCWLNSITQVFLSIPFIMHMSEFISVNQKLLRKAKVKIGSDEKPLVDEEAIQTAIVLRNLYLALNSRKDLQQKAPAVGGLYTILGFPFDEISIQKDMMRDGSMAIVNRLNSTNGFVSLLGPLQIIMHSITISDTSETDEKEPTQTTEVTSLLQIPVSDQNSVSSALKKLSTGIQTSAGRYENATSSTTYRRFMNSPPVLQIGLNRYQYKLVKIPDNEIEPYAIIRDGKKYKQIIVKDNRYKDCNRILLLGGASKLPEDKKEIYINETAEQLVAQLPRSLTTVPGAEVGKMIGGTDTGETYMLHAVIIHSGTETGGHYYTYIKEYNGTGSAMNDKASENLWIKYDDEIVREATWEEVQRDACGTTEEQIAETKSSTYLEDDSILTESGTSAYYCLYINEKHLPQLLGLM
ncbi:MAG: ubiquitin carboxyl-terminal hydrolase [Holosporales bacterium]|nr:ubiquitin carboxyl-terminal hydrolase [Holosporales bacterium]